MLKKIIIVINVIVLLIFEQVHLSKMGGSVLRITSKNNNPFDELHAECKTDFKDDNIYFHIYNRDISKYAVITTSNFDKFFQNSSLRFDPSHMVKIYIHGWFQSSKHGHPLANGYMTVMPDVNFIILDWSNYSGCAYFYVVQNIVSKVANVLSNFINALYKIGLSSKKIHLIGFSFGAHIAGLASMNLEENKVFRITGLDPSGIPFNMYSRKNRLDHTSAKFVDVIRTSVYGMFNRTGHADFYPNGGFHQPGCTGVLFSLCDHNRSVQYFTESITSPIGFYSVPCSVLRSAEAPHNEVDEILMGEYTNTNISGIYCLKTNAIGPFAKGRFYKLEN